MATFRRRKSAAGFGVTNKAPKFPQKAWTEALAAAEIDDFRFHDLRHTAASYLAMNGATLAEIAEILGHKTLTVTRRYSHLTDSHVDGVVESMVDRFFSSRTSD